MENNYITSDGNNFFMCTDKIPEFEELLFTLTVTM